ncbi:MAG: hypothetical protein QG632_745 [Candidatus Dependentiae bacterium]|nr:hypothetical protein [Candidatus Dependentiae bacterium]
MALRQVVVPRAFKICPRTIVIVAPVTADPAIWPPCILIDDALILHKSIQCLPNANGEYQNMPMVM